MPPAHGRANTARMWEAEWAAFDHAQQGILTDARMAAMKRENAARQDRIRRAGRCAPQRGCHVSRAASLAQQQPESAAVAARAAAPPQQKIPPSPPTSPPPPLGSTTTPSADTAAARLWGLFTGWQAELQGPASDEALGEVAAPRPLQAGSGAIAQTPPSPPRPGPITAPANLISLALPTAAQAATCAQGTSLLWTARQSAPPRLLQGDASFRLLRTGRMEDRHPAAEAHPSGTGGDPPGGALQGVGVQDLIMQELRTLLRWHSHMHLFYHRRISEIQREALNTYRVSEIQHEPLGTGHARRWQTQAIPLGRAEGPIPPARIKRDQYGQPQCTDGPAARPPGDDQKGRGSSKPRPSATQTQASNAQVASSRATAAPAPAHPQAHAQTSQQAKHHPAPLVICFNVFQFHRGVYVSLAITSGLLRSLHCSK